MNIDKYLKVFRLDHWIKNVFMLIGAFGAIFLNDHIHGVLLYIDIGIAFLLSCFISSVNYVINEILDASFDALHPVKKHRPIPSGQITLYKLIVSALVLLACTFIISLILFDKPFNVSLLALFIAGLVYNVRPIRAKDIPFIDVIAESINNPIRLFIGWYAVSSNFSPPPVSIIVFFWVLGAFLMTAKRVAELKLLNKNNSLLYRPTFKYYSAKNLNFAFFLYAVSSVLVSFFIAYKYKNTLYYSLPLYIIFILWYIKLTYEEKSIVMDPEHVYRRPLFCVYIIFCCIFTFLSLLING